MLLIIIIITDSSESIELLSVFLLNSLMGFILKGTEKLYTTDYQNAFIQVAEDCGLTQAVIPSLKVKKGAVEPVQTQARIQYELLKSAPYKYSSDDVLFAVYARQQNLAGKSSAQQRIEFFSKPKACFRASPLGKKFGWGVHFNQEGKMAIYGMETTEYRQLTADPAISQYKAMRSSRKMK